MTDSQQLIHPKPKEGQPCNGCGYCCTVQPCTLASEFLGCDTGPCVALEVQNGTSGCGLVRNPLAYLFLVAHPNTDRAILNDASVVADGADLSAQIAAALGVGRGCDTLDDRLSAAWPQQAGRA